MLKRNASKSSRERKNLLKQKHNQRLRDIAQADVSFINSVEENTNFMVPAGRRKNKAGKSEHARTILS